MEGGRQGGKEGKGGREGKGEREREWATDGRRERVGEVREGGEERKKMCRKTQTVLRKDNSETEREKGSERRGGGGGVSLIDHQ